MDKKSSPLRRQKRQLKTIEENFWECSVCTFQNTIEAFKCNVCDVRKGTSTRKPRLNSTMVAQQVATLPGASGASGAGLSNGGSSKGASGSRHGHGVEKSKHKKCLARLKNVDRSTAQTREITVNSVTVFITEYKPKASTNGRRESSEQSFGESNDSRS